MTADWQQAAALVLGRYRTGRYTPADKRWLAAQVRAAAAGQLTDDQAARVAELRAEIMGHNRQTFDAHNNRRTGRAPRRTVAAARAALANPPVYGWSDHDTTIRVLRARVDHPQASLAELADRVGMTKDAYAGRLRRTLAAHRDVTSEAVA
jgi:hypothetical protein